MSFLGELKRRNVYRVAALYIIVSWLVLQVDEVLHSVKHAEKRNGHCKQNLH